MIFTSAVSFLCSVSAFAAAWVIYFRRKIKDRLMNSYAYFLWATSALWFFVGTELFFGWLGNESLFVFFFIMNQIFVFLSGPPMAFYLCLKIFKNLKMARIIGLIYFVAAIAGFIFMAKFGIIEGESTYFADKLQPNQYSFFIFIFMVIPLILASVVDSLRRFFLVLVKKNTEQIYDLLYSFAITVYLAFGFFDEQGYVVGWELVFFRLLIAMAFLGVYLTFYFQFLKHENFIEKV